MALAYGKIMGKFSGGDIDLGGNYVSILIDKNSMGYLLNICLFYNILSKYKLKKNAYACAPNTYTRCSNYIILISKTMEIPTVEGLNSLWFVQKWNNTAIKTTTYCVIPLA